MKYFVRRRHKPFVITMDFFGYTYEKIKYVFVVRARCSVPLDKEKVKKILILSLDLIGDGILATPAIRTIRENFPDAEITTLVGKWNEEIFKSNSGINKVEVIDPFWTRSTNLNVWQKLKLFIKIYKNIRKNNYDLGVDLRGEFLSILLMKKAGAKYMVGYGITGGGWMLDKCVEYKGDRFAKHVVERNLDILRAIGLKISDNLDLLIYTNEDSKKTVNNFLQKNDIKESDKIIVIHPGSNDQARCWENEKWAETIVELLKDESLKIILSGGPKDEETIKHIMEHATRSMKQKENISCQLDKQEYFMLRVLCFMDYSILDFAELVGGANLVLCVNSAALHIACAQKIPVVTLFSGSYPKTYGPWGNQNQKSVVLFKNAKCFPCGKKTCENNICMKDISVNEVMEGVATLTSKHVL